MEINTPDEELHHPASGEKNDSEHLSGESALVAEEHLLETDEQSIQEVSFNKYIYSDIIFHPKATFKRLLKVNGSVWVKRRVLLLLFLVCIPQTLTTGDFSEKFADMNGYYAVVGILEYVFLALAKNILIGGSIILIFLVLCLMVGRKILDRDVRLRDYSTILAWSLIPAIFSNFGLLGVQAIMNKVITAQYVFTHNAGSTLTTLQIVLVAIVIMKEALWLWTGCLFVFGIYVLHASNMGQTMFNVIIPLLIAAAIFVSAMFFVTGVSALGG